MKKLLLSLIFLCCAQFAIAQPVLTAAMNNPMAGETFYRNYCDPSGVTIGAAGAAVTWDFSTLPVTAIDTLRYISCSDSIPPCSYFPGSTLVTGDSSSEFFYYIADTAKLAADGDYESGSRNTTATDPQTIISYPFTYISSLVDSYYFHNYIYDYTSYGVDSFHADGYGTLILPSGTYTNALRIRLITHDTEITTSTTDYYSYVVYIWYAPGFHNSLLTIQYDSSYSPNPVAVAYYTHMPPTGFQTLQDEHAFNIFPNPAAGELHVQLTSAMNREATVTLMDMTGRTVAVKENSGSIGGVTFNVASLPAEMYIVRVQAGSETLLRKVIINR